LRTLHHDDVVDPLSDDVDEHPVPILAGTQALLVPPDRDASGLQFLPKCFDRLMVFARIAQEGFWGVRAGFGPRSYAC